MKNTQIFMVLIFIKSMSLEVVILAFSYLDKMITMVHINCNSAIAFYIIRGEDHESLKHKDYKTFSICSFVF